jgi:hypothetical protein
VVERASNTTVSLALTTITMTLSEVVGFEVILGVSRRG